jgi:uncharacterized protein YndB with AHSA1/START domain
MMSRPSCEEDELDPSGEMVLTRIIRVERGLVWRLWTESSHLAAWWGPHGFTNPQCTIDATPGGVVRILMCSPSGEEYLNVGTVRVADEPRLLVFSIALVNSDGTVRLENLTTVELEDRDRSTLVTVRVQVLRATPEASENLVGMRDGWSESLERLTVLEARTAGR